MSKKEAVIQKQIINFLRKNFPDACLYKLSEETLCGIPDLLFICDGYVFFFEVKKKDGRVKPLQHITLDHIKSNLVPAEVVRSVEDVKKCLFESGLTKQET